MHRLGEQAHGSVRYSTDASAYDLLVARLARSEILTACERVGSTWYCTLSGPAGKGRERLATGAGPTRSAAACRAVLNLPAERLRLDPGKTPGSSASD
jgi:hypothetical protein